MSLCRRPRSTERGLGPRYPKDLLDLLLRPSLFPDAPGNRGEIRTPPGFAQSPLGCRAPYHFIVRAFIVMAACDFDASLPCQSCGRFHLHPSACYRSLRARRHSLAQPYTGPIRNNSTTTPPNVRNTPAMLIGPPAQRHRLWKLTTCGAACGKIEHQLRRQGRSRTSSACPGGLSSHAPARKYSRTILVCSGVLTDSDERRWRVPAQRVMK
jgi:hypothetical protein